MVSPAPTVVRTSFEPDPSQRLVLDHERGPMVVTGEPGTGKTAILLERFARLIESGANAERVALVVRSRHARIAARDAVLGRLRRALPAAAVFTVYGLAYHTMAMRFGSLGYRAPPATLTAFDQFARVAELLASEDPSEWPTFGSMLELRGFADEVRQFLQRAQESLLTPDELLATASERGSGGWVELAGFYRRYLDVLATAGEVDFAGLVAQAARAAELTAGDEALFDHVLVDDYQDATLAEEALVTHLAGRSLTVAGDLASHVFSFQGTTDVPLRRLADADEGVSKVDLTVRH